jgi:peroxiredoxin
MPPLVRRCLFLPAVFAVLLPFGAARSDEAPTTLGKKIDDFTLKDTSGKEWRLSGVKDARAVVVVFVGTECPVSNAFMPRLAELHKEFTDKGVAFVVINSNSQDTPDRVAAAAKKHDLPFPMLKDGGNAIADVFGAKRTPEAFLLDGERKVRYRGRIDDQYGIGFNRTKATRRDLAEALGEVLDGKPVTTATTVAPGCLIGRLPKPKEVTKVTYAREVSRILQNRCQECHRPNQIGPMALMTYDDTIAWSDTIREVVQERRMPPWHADPKHGKFENDRSLPGEERDALLAWIAGGCPKGDDKDLPKAKEFADGWRIGKPDAVFKMVTESRVPATAPRGGVPYRYSIAKTDFAEDRWIQAAEAKAGAVGVVHHIIVYILKPGERPGTGAEGIGNGFLVGYAPGDMPAVFPAGTAKKLPRGATLVFQLHYTPNGTAVSDRSEVGLIFAKKPPEVEMRTHAITGKRFTIAAGDANSKVTSTMTFKEDGRLYSFLPHMHLRGKSFEYKAVYPDGKEEVLLSVPRYDFGWQSNYRLAKPLDLPAGTRIDCTAYFDNSDKNPNNPDPTKDVRWGDQTWQEMMIGFIDYAYMPKK